MSASVLTGGTRLSQSNQPSGNFSSQYYKFNHSPRSQFDQANCSSWLHVGHVFRIRIEGQPLSNQPMVGVSIEFPTHVRYKVLRRSKASKLSHMAQHSRSANASGDHISPFSASFWDADAKVVGWVDGCYCLMLIGWWKASGVKSIFAMKLTEMFASLEVRFNRSARAKTVTWCGWANVFISISPKQQGTPAEIIPIFNARKSLPKVVSTQVANR